VKKATWEKLEVENSVMGRASDVEVKAELERRLKNLTSGKDPGLTMDQVFEKAP